MKDREASSRHEEETVLPWIFHLAVPCADLDAIQGFYVDGLGCRLGRRMDDRVTIRFYDHQVVFQLQPDAVDAAPSMYPRHFGITFRMEADFDRALQRARQAGLKFFREPFHRFAGRPDEHRAFFLQDPSNNLVEFKFYHDQDMMY